MAISCKDITYRRLAMAASKKVIVDEIDPCAKDFFEFGQRGRRYSIKSNMWYIS